VDLLSPEDIREARRALGRQWGLGRDLSQAELAEALGLANKDAVREMERGGFNTHSGLKVTRITGPVTVAIRAMLAGYLPREAPDDAKPVSWFGPGPRVFDPRRDPEAKVS
jgi:hypothetical protein